MFSHSKNLEINHQGLGGLSCSHRVREALNLLQDYEWIIREKISSNIVRSHEYWILNPRAFEKNN